MQSLQYLLPCSRRPLHDVVLLVPPALLLLLLLVLPILLVLPALLLLLDLPTLQSSATGSRACARCVCKAAVPAGTWAGGQVGELGMQRRTHSKFSQKGAVR